MAQRKETVIVLDFGGQYTLSLARKIRELKVYCEIFPYSTPPEKIKKLAPAALILSGEAAGVYDASALPCPPEYLGLGIPVLGVSYGMLLMGKILGGEVLQSKRREYGLTPLHVSKESAFLNKIGPEAKVWMDHADLVVKAPPGFKVDAWTENTPVAAMSCPDKRLYAVQFHPEALPTGGGMTILKTFLFDVCGLAGSWNMGSFVAEMVEKIKEEVEPGEQAVCGLSGGVDSSVAASLVHMALGDRLKCIFVDHGLLRKDEAKQVMEAFEKKLKMKVIHVDAGKAFLSKLKGVSDPEQKRKIIGREFIRVFEKEARKLGHMDYLVQGTVYPDVIESGAGTAAVIKSHHNVGGLPEDMALKLIEPLKQLFKDEVRQVGRELGLPADIINRHPFPGPGLAIRVLGEVTEEKLSILREADAIFIEELRKANLYDKIWQAFALLPDIRSVGVTGNSRTYEYTVALRAVTSTDGMTADWYRMPYEVLEKVSGRIVNEVPRVNRVVYDLTTKPPSTIEWE